MSFEAKLILFACVLAVIGPLAAIVLRRMIRGDSFDKTKMGDTVMPPSGPSVDSGS